MKKKWKDLLLRAVVPAVLAVLMVPMTAFAEPVSSDASSVHIPFELNVSGTDVPADASYRFEIKALETAPAPAETAVTMSADGTGSFGPIAYTKPGDYYYQIKQVTADREHFEIDKKTYTVMVRVVHSQTVNGRMDAWICGWEGTQAGNPEFGSEGKKESFSFDNAYTYQPGGGSGGNGGGGSSSGGGGSSSGGGPSNNGGTPAGGPGVQGDGLTTIGDGNTPLSALESLDDGAVPLAELVENLVPLAGLPTTGDTTNLAIWVLMMVVSGLGLTVLARTRKFVLG